MKIRNSDWIILTIAAILSLFLWFKFTFHQFSVVNLRIDRSEALQLSKNYLLQKHNIDLHNFKSAVVFTSDYEADRYLQNSLGFSKEQAFLKKHDFDLFFWLIRFFQENSNEEFRMTVSSKTGEVIAYSHKLDENTSKIDLGQEASRDIALKFLQGKFGLNPQEYSTFSENSQKYDGRTDYYFAWQKNDVYIPWSKKENSGGSKLLTSTIVSGSDVISFTKNIFYTPEQYQRYKERQMKTGALLSTIFRIFYLGLLVVATYFVIARRHHLVMHSVKKFAVILTIVLLIVTIVHLFNQFEFFLFNYPMTYSFSEYLFNQTLNEFLAIFFATIGFLMFILSGESLQKESFPNKKEGAFLYYVKTTFLSRDVFLKICLGYLVFLIMLGIQASAYKFGESNFKIWIEHNRLVQLSTNYFPFLSALIIGLKSSIVEETTYRVFALSWGKKIFKNTIVSVIFASLIWGLAHSGYYIFPMWFRIIEIAGLGIFLCFVYLRFGLIPVLVGHFLFDVFWNTAEYLFGQSHAVHFFTTQLILLSPLLFGIFAYFKNKSIEEQPLQWQLNNHQIFNSEILETYLISGNFLEKKSKEELCKELVGHGWDQSVVEVVLSKLSQH